MTIIITNTHLNNALGLGVHRARAEVERGLLDPFDDVWDAIEQRDLIFEVTGEKIEPGTPEGWLILDAYENGYYDEWDDNA